MTILGGRPFWMVPYSERRGEKIPNSENFSKVSSDSFSEGGAMQIAQDFAALRQWINMNKNLKGETRRYLLLLDSIRRCEGVAKLLLSKQGEMLDVRPAKTNKVAPINTGTCYYVFHWLTFSKI